MARKCGFCRQEGHTRTTCPDAGTEQVTCKQCGNEFSATEGSGAVFCSKTCFEYNRDGKTGSPWKPVLRTCACGEITTMGPFPGRHEMMQCGTHVRLISTDGEDLTEAYSPQEPFTDDPFTTPTKEPDPFDRPGPWFPAGFEQECDGCGGAIFQGDEIHADGSGGYECRDCGDEEPHPDESPVTSPVTDHRKWCTRCKLLGHYAADCKTAVLAGGVVSVPEPAPATHTGRPTQHTSPYVAAMACEQCDTDGHLCKGCGEPVPHGAVACLACNTPPKVFVEPDPFESPTQPTEELNVSGQPSARYEWYGKQNRGYLVKLPETGDFRRYKNGKPKGLTRVTTFNKAATDQNALGDWKARNVLIGASKRPDLVARAHGLTHEDNRDELMKLVAELETTAGAKVSADVGTLIHGLTERWDAGVLKFDDIPAAYRGLMERYTDALNEAGLRPVPGLIERTTYIPEFGGVVGTLDRVYYHEASGQYVIGDVKTGKTLKYGMDEIETQEWIYAHGVNLNGVYDWNTDTWDAMWEGAAIPPEWQPMTSVSEDWGVVIHMPVQGEDAGKCLLVEADLQRGKRHAEVCHQVREERANKPKPKPWTGERLKAPEMPAETDWDTEFSEVLSREDAAAVWQEAYDRGVPPEEMARLKEIADARLAELADKAFTPWEEDFRSVATVADAGRLWEEARADGVDPLELNRLVSLAQQRLRELGISG